MEVDYAKYLNLDSLLSSQKPLTEKSHDELLFITVHQTYELWFKQLLHEGKKLSILLSKNNDPISSLSVLDRMLSILKLLVKQTDILETMAPANFAEFRENLDNSSGFQSHQFRKLEFFLGLKNKNKLDIFRKNKQEFNSLFFYYSSPSIYDVLLIYINSLQHYEIPLEILEQNLSIHRVNPDPRIEKTLLEIYKKDVPLKILCEKFVDFDEGMQEWRYRHIKMVERTIGTNMGTGGSSGAKYLKDTLFQPAFIELWTIRNQFF